MIIIGIDPGLSGAIAFYNTDTHEVTVHDMPTVEVKRGAKAKREIAPALVAKALMSRGPVHAAFVERVGAMPGQGVSSVFSFGYSTGVVIGALAALEIYTTIIPPQTWQKSMAVRGGKEGSRARAMEIWPGQADLFKRVKDDGRADASLIAAHGAKEVSRAAPQG
jgi:crossover junction endodeoxyribonuclease RuvC